MKKQFFYGWVIVAAAIFIVGTGTFFHMNAFSLFLNPLSEELGLSITSIMLCSTIGGYVNSFLTPVFGKIIDQKGIRFAGTLCGLIMAAAYLVLSFARNFTVLCLGYIIMNMTCIGPMFTSVICSKWFKKYTGLVNGIISAGAGLFVTILSPVISKTILGSGVSGAYLSCAAIIVVTVALLSLVFLRNSPQEMGQYPDGAKAPAEEQGSAAKGTELQGFTLKEAMRTAGFWLVVIGFLTYMFADLSLFRTYVAHIQSKGFDPLTAAGCASFFGLISIAAKLIYGYLSDKIPIKICTVIGWGCLIACCLAGLNISAGTSSTFLYVFVGLLAFGHSCWPPLFMKFIMYTCGVKHFSTVYGTGFSIFNIISMFGPIFAGAVFDLQGSYNTAYTVFIGCIAVSIVLLMLVKPGDFSKPEEA